MRNRNSEIRNPKSTIEKHGFQTDVGTRDDPGYGERFYGEERQTVAALYDEERQFPYENLKKMAILA